MHTAIRHRSQNFSPADGARTLTITNDSTREGTSTDEEEQSNSEGENIIGSLRLTGGNRRTQRVAWDEDVIDNEGCGKKKSKICCIYHKPRRFDESSSEESSSSDSEDGGNGECRHTHSHGHDHDHDRYHSRHPNSEGGSSSGSGGGGGGRRQMRDNRVSMVVKRKEDLEPNAYEKQPSSTKGKGRAV